MRDEVRVLSDRIGAALWQAQHTVGLAVEHKLSQEGVGLSQVLAMMHLREQPKLSGAALSRLMLITPQSAATLLAQLELRGWIHRAAHPIHRGVLEARLSAEGEAKLDGATKIMDDFDAVLGAKMTSEERGQLHRSLTICLSAAREILSNNSVRKHKAE